MDKIDSDHLNGHSIALIIDSIINLLIETKLLNSNFFNEDSKRDFIEECVLKHLSKEYDCCPNKFDPTERFKIIKKCNRHFTRI